MNAQAIATVERIHPLTGEPSGRRSAPRVDLAEAFAAQFNATKRQRKVEATYDLVRDSDDFKNHWANADSFNADSANNVAVRRKAVKRSRYEIANNGYADGIAQTYATDLVGTGPKLRMQTGSEGFNRMVEFQWGLWVQAVKLRRKLWCQAHAKISDGEGFGVARTNPRVKHDVKLDYVLYETEQFHSPNMPYEPGYIDGMRFDEWGNVEFYELLRAHPGSTNQIENSRYEPEQIPAKYVTHWFMLRRPGQHRGMPEMTSTLLTGAAARRWREATLAKAETQADFTLFLKTIFQPDELASVTPMSTLEIQKRMMTALPNNVEPYQLENNTPGASFEAFNRSLISEQARPKGMPYNRAAADSSGHNFASGKLDFMPYFEQLDVDREDGNDLVLDPLFDVWFDEAVRVFGWLGGNPDAIGPAARAHIWDWPAHEVADEEARANANATKLKTGQVTLSSVYSEAGEEFESRLVVMAADYGKTVDEMREALFTTIFNSQSQLASMEQAATQAKTATSPSRAPAEGATANA